MGLTSVTSLARSQSPALEAPRSGDRVAELQRRIDLGQVRLGVSSGGRGYLPALLAALDIPADSQVLVFSKTSLQFENIGPATPRAIYFNDDTAVASVRGGRVLEITTAGADGSLKFYTLETAPVATPQVEREGDLCLACHGATGLPAAAMIVDNVIPLDDGAPLIVRMDRLFDLTDSTTPFDQRWGGWYVTGLHGAMRHNANVRLDAAHPNELDPTSGLNLTDLSSRFDTAPYLEPTSDIVALMTFEHQIGAMNRIWSLQALSRDLGRGEAADAKLGVAVDDLARYLVGADEAPLPSPVTGVSTFSRTFPARGPRDTKGRSLRDLDLQTRLFRYPLSYMIYSRAFDSLTPDLRARVYRRLFEMLSGLEPNSPLAATPIEQRRAAIQILRETKSGLPDYWVAKATAPVKTRPPRL